MLKGTTQQLLGVTSPLFVNLYTEYLKYPNLAVLQMARFGRGVPERVSEMVEILNMLEI